MQVTDRTYLFHLEVLRKRPQNSARHHAVVHPISPAAGRDGGLPSGGHLFPPAGHLLELHQSNVSQHHSFAFSSIESVLLAESPMATFSSMKKTQHEKRAFKAYCFVFTRPIVFVAI